MGCLLSKGRLESDEEYIINHPDAHPESRVNSGKRQISATSKHSTDSGFNDEDINKALKKNAIGIMREPNRALPERQTERTVMEMLQKEGLIQRNVNSKPLGVSFEILTEDDKEFASALRRPPPRLAKIEEQRNKRPPLTEEEIRQKLQRVEERRQKLRAKKAKRNEEMQRCNSMDLPKIIEETESKSKAEIAAENRAQRLQEKLDKIERRKKHAEEVRRRKQLAPPNETGTENEAYMQN